MKKKILVSLLLLAVIVPGAAYLLGYFPFAGEAVASEADEEHVEVDSHGVPISKNDSLYLPLNPPFVVNYTHLGILRYLQISLEVMYSEQELLDRVSAKMPAIRNDLILLLGNQDYDKLSTLSGKEAIREEMLAAINHLILTEEETDHIGKVYITNYVMQ